MLKSLFDKISGKKTETTTQQPTDKIFTPKQIARYLKKALLTHELIEVKVGKQPALCYTFLHDAPADYGTDGDDQQPSNAHYERGDYLDDHQCLFITPIEKTKGKQEITPENKLTFFFYLGAMCYTFAAQYEESLESDGEPLVRLSFPEQFKGEPGRKFHRVKIPTDYAGNVVFTDENGHVEEASLLNLSAGGLAFIYPPSLEEAHENDKITLGLTLNNNKQLTLHGTIRKFARMPCINPDTEQYEKFLVCGVQFHLTDQNSLSSIEEEVVSLQRLELQRLIK